MNTNSLRIITDIPNVEDVRRKLRVMRPELGSTMQAPTRHSLGLSFFF